MTAAPPTPREELFGSTHRAVTVGIVLLISLTAFEAMGVGTAMPALVADLGTVSSYAWPFVAFIAATVVGTVLGGRWCDTHGPRRTLLGGPTVFGVGLLVAGSATTMTQLLVGRVLQGLGAGATGVSVYVLIALVYSVRARPAVFALISSAGVVPSLVGPPLAGFVTERLSWHWASWASRPGSRGCCSSPRRGACRGWRCPRWVWPGSGWGWGTPRCPSCCSRTRRPTRSASTPPPPSSPTSSPRRSSSVEPVETTTPGASVIPAGSSVMVRPSARLQSGTCVTVTHETKE